MSEPSPSYELEIHQEPIQVTSMGHHELDPQWSMTDAAGHVHATLDTLVWTVIGWYWCEDCRDEHDEGEYRCAQCEATVKPNYVFTGPETFYMPGLKEGILRVPDDRPFLTRIFYLRPEELATITQPPTEAWLAKVTSRGSDDLSLIDA